MADAEEPALFTLSAHDAAARIAQMFSGAAARSMFRVPVGAALMLAEAATQKLSLHALRTRESGCLPPTDTFETVEQLVAMYLEGEPATLDSVLWDQEGYVHGWPLDQDGRAHARQGSFPETVRALAQALRTLSPCLPDWRELLESHAIALETILHNSRKHAELVAQQRVASQSWLSRLRKPRSIAAELVSLGFTGDL